jgi:hypothetical protein
MIFIFIQYLFTNIFYLKVWINQGDIILISLRDYQDAKADVILKYTTEEARNLKTYGELPENGIVIILSESPSSYFYSYLPILLFY